MAPAERPLAGRRPQRNTWRRRTLRLAVAAAVVVAAAGAARAQSAPPPAPYPYPPPALYAPPASYPPPPEPAAVLALRPPEPPAPLGPAPTSDPQADRVVLLPTAFTQPKGTFFASTYDIAILQAGYALTDDTQLSLTALPIPSENATILDVTAKTVVYRGPFLRAAALGSVSGAIASDVGAVFIGRVGAVAQGCLRPACDSSLVLSSNITLVGVMLMVNGAGAIVRVSEHLSLLGELATLIPIGSAAGQFNGGMVSGGLRLHYRNWGFDFTGLHPFRSDVPFVPLLSATYRSL
jgi:hypothetical protein